MSVRGKRHKQRKRLKVWCNSGGVCAYCGVPLSVDEMTLDHVLPKAKGGDSGVGNLVAACRTCNEIKGDRESGSLGFGFWRQYR